MLDWLANRWNDFITFCYSIVLSVYDMLKDAGCFLFESVSNLIIHVLNGFTGVLSSFNVVQYIDLIPDDTKQIMALCGVNEASSIIVTAILIRLGLQLIPFTRLGS